MKIISLNTWGGRGGLEKLLEFFKNNNHTDIFCLQEIWSEGKGNHMIGVRAGNELTTGVSTTLLQDIEKILTNHNIYFRPHFFDYYGLAMFVKKDLKVVEEGDIFVYKEHGYISEEEAGNHARNIQYITVETKDGLRTIINFMVFGMEKERLTQKIGFYNPTIL